MKKAFIDNWHIIISELLVLVFFLVFLGKFGDIMVDSFREIYIPQQILNGKVLYKDIFVIYPPLGYLINASVLKIFNSSSEILNLMSFLSTGGIIFFTSKISELFCNKAQAFSISLFLISALILSPNVFNAFLPYSFGLLYGILFCLVAIYCVLNKKFPYSYLFCALAILCKYEFILLTPILLLLSKKVDFKRNLIMFIIPFLLVLTILLIQGVRINDILASFEIVGAISSSKTLHWFYSVMGLEFRLELIPIYIANFLKFLLPINWDKYQEILVWALPFIFICGVFKVKKMSKRELFFILATLLVSLKVFFAVTLQSYGVYFLPFVLVSLYLVIPQKCRNYLCVLLIVWSLIVGISNIKILLNKKCDLSHVVSYVKENTLPTDRVVVYPECLGVNVLSKRSSDNKFYSLIPLYVEAFGEDLIINRLKITKPEYIIINNYDTSAYYFKEFGADYAQNIFMWINNNYEHLETINDYWEFKIYKLKNKL